VTDKRRGEEKEDATCKEAQRWLENFLNNKQASINKKPAHIRK